MHPLAAPTRNLESISPFFIVKNLQASISHYIERFGLSWTSRVPLTTSTITSGYSVFRAATS